VITVASIGFVARVSRIKDDTAIGIMYTGVFAAGVVLVSVFRNHIHIDLMHFIMGDVLGVADHDLWVSVLAASLVLSVIVLFFRQFQLTTFDPVMAATIGMPVVLIDYALTTCVSLVVVSAVSMVGVILVVGLLITPAASAYLLSDRLDRMMVLAALFGVTSVVADCISACGSTPQAAVRSCSFAPSSFWWCSWWRPVTASWPDGYASGKWCRNNSLRTSSPRFRGAWASLFPYLT